MPRATSSAIAPVGMTSIGGRVSSPRRITAPLPCCFSICAITASRDFVLSATAAMPHLPFLVIEVRRLPATRTKSVLILLSSQTLGAPTDKALPTARGLWTRRCRRGPLCTHYRTHVRGKGPPRRISYGVPFDTSQPHSTARRAGPGRMEPGHGRAGTPSVAGRNAGHRRTEPGHGRAGTPGVAGRKAGHRRTEPDMAGLNPDMAGLNPGVA